MPLMLSISFLNAALNAALWLAHSLLALLLQGIYVFLAKLQLSRQRKTKATDSDETNIFHWLTSSIFSHRLTLTDTAIWSFALMIFAVLFLPAELIFETGIDVRLDCEPHLVSSPDGVCASPWNGHSDVGVASAALLVQRFSWIDQNWQIVFEGASKSMLPTEVRTLSNNKLSGDLQKIFAYNCVVDVKPCQQCGEVTLTKSGGPFDTIVSNFSGENLHDKFALGDLTYDGAMGAAFLFWQAGEDRVRNEEGTVLNRIKVQGVEAMLNDAQVDRVLLGEAQPWEMQLFPDRTRMYEIRCDSPGLMSRDLAHAISLYRTTMMEQPGVRRDDVGDDMEQWPPLTGSDALKALFALKAEDGSESCQRVLPVYRTCGSFDWSKATMFFALSVLVSVGWMVLCCASRSVSNVGLPHDSRSWRDFVLSGSKQCEFETGRGVGGKDSFVLVLKPQTATSVFSTAEGEVSIDLGDEEPPSV